MNEIPGVVWCVTLSQWIVPCVSLPHTPLCIMLSGDNSTALAAHS